MWFGNCNRIPNTYGRCQYSQIMILTPLLIIEKRSNRFYLLYKFLWRFSIRDLPTILEGISEAISTTRSLMMITEHVRTRLARQLSNANANEFGVIPLVTLSPEWEHAFAESIIGEGDERQLAMAPTALQGFITKVRNVLEDLAVKGETAVLLTSPAIRPFVRSIIERFRPLTVVMSQNEIHPKAKIKTVGQI